MRKLAQTSKLVIRSTIGFAITLPVVFVFAAFRYHGKCTSPRPSCLAHRQAGCNVDGDYQVQLGGRILDVTCDMKTDGGGWTLVANYLHKVVPASSERAKLLPLIDRLPVQTGSPLGTDESGTPAWGHASTSLLSLLPMREVRFKCRSSGHSRLVDFSLSSRACLEYFRTGKGTCLGKPELRDEFRRSVHSLPGHNGELLSANEGWRDRGDNAMMAFPFYLNWKTAWDVGTPDRAANRWNCDDFHDPAVANTHHQIWIR